MKQQRSDLATLALLRPLSHTHTKTHKRTDTQAGGHILLHSAGQCVRWAQPCDLPAVPGFNVPHEQWTIAHKDASKGGRSDKGRPDSAPFIAQSLLTWVFGLHSTWTVRSFYFISVRWSSLKYLNAALMKQCNKDAFIIIMLLKSCMLCCAIDWNAMRELVCVCVVAALSLAALWVEQMEWRGILAAVPHIIKRYAFSHSCFLVFVSRQNESVFKKRL